MKDDRVIDRARLSSWLLWISRLSQRDCAYLIRFSPPGGVSAFNDEELWGAFQAHFESVGGMTPTLSKSIGWDPPEGWTPSRPKETE